MAASLRALLFFLLWNRASSFLRSFKTWVRQFSMRGHGHLLLDVNHSPSAHSLSSVALPVPSTSSTGTSSPLWTRSMTSLSMPILASAFRNWWLLSCFNHSIWMAWLPTSKPRMMYGVAGFHSFGLGLSGRLRSGFGIIEAQKLGCNTRGVEMKRECGRGGASMAKERACRRIGGVSTVRWATGIRNSWRKRLDESMITGCFNGRASSMMDVWGEMERGPGNF